MLIGRSDLFIALVILIKIDITSSCINGSALSRSLSRFRAESGIELSTLSSFLSLSLRLIFLVVLFIILRLSSILRLFCRFCLYSFGFNGFCLFLNRLSCLILGIMLLIILFTISQILLFFLFIYCGSFVFSRLLFFNSLLRSVIFFRLLIRTFLSFLFSTCLFLGRLLFRSFCLCRLIFLFSSLCFLFRLRIVLGSEISVERAYFI